MPVSTAPATAALLDAVDRGRGASWLDRGLSLAELMGDDPAWLGAAPVGRLQRTALELHEVLAGTALEATAPCPACGTDVEFAVPVGTLLALADHERPSGELVAAGIESRWRVPSVDDLRSAIGSPDPEAALRGRCLRAQRGEVDLDPAQLPADLLAAIERAIADGDPLAEVLVDLDCPECATAFVADLDPIGYVWADLEARAIRTLREVDELARAYGWTEGEILALPPLRRAAYLAIVRGERP